jgi:hypothetical protein
LLLLVVTLLLLIGICVLLKFVVIVVAVSSSAVTGLAGGRGCVGMITPDFAVAVLREGRTLWWLVGLSQAHDKVSSKVQRLRLT